MTDQSSCPCASRAEVVAREWERQSKQWEGVVREQRATLDGAKRAIEGLKEERERYAKGMVNAAIDIDKMERERDHALAERAELSRQLAELTQLVGTETPIAAFDLATSWQVEKALYQDHIALLRSRARAVVISQVIQPGELVLVSSAALAELEKELNNAE
jgi:hypothetical protein